MAAGLVLGLSAFEAAAALLMGLDFPVNTMPEVLAYAAILTGEVLLFFTALRKLWGPTPRLLLLGKIPSVRDLVFWLWLPALFASRGTYLALFHGYRLESPEFAPVVVAAVLSEALWAPVKEEAIFRGMLFAGLRNWGRPAAYAVTTVVFVMAHTESISVLLADGTTGLHWGMILLLSMMSVGLNRMYEKTGGLLLCIVIHSMANLVQHVAMVLGAILELGPLG